MSVLKQTARRGRTEENPRAAQTYINEQTDASGAYLLDAAHEMAVLNANAPTEPILCGLSSQLCRNGSEIAGCHAHDF